MMAPPERWTPSQVAKFLDDPAVAFLMTDSTDYGNREDELSDDEDDIRG